MGKLHIEPAQAGNGARTQAQAGARAGAGAKDPAGKYAQAGLGGKEAAGPKGQRGELQAASGGRGFLRQASILALALCLLWELAARPLLMALWPDLALPDSALRELLALIAAVAGL